MPTKLNRIFDLKYNTTITDGIITFTNPNTTLGFVRFKESGAIEYIFVQPMYRRMGLATKLLEQVSLLVNNKLFPEPPISPLGELLFEKVSYA
jgi:hypothetical protein